MNKKELIGRIAEKTNLSKKNIDLALSEIFDSIKYAMAQSEKVAIKGFGTFGSRKRAPKTGRHPKTGELINIPARVVPTFSPGSALKESVMDNLMKKSPEKAAKKTAPKKKAAPAKKKPAKKK